MMKCNTNEIKKKRKTRTSDRRVPENIENRAKATSRMNEHTREQVIEELFEKAQYEDAKKHDACLKVYRLHKEIEVKNGSEERRGCSTIGETTADTVCKEREEKRRKR